MDSIQVLFLGTGTSTGLPLTPCLTISQPYPPEFQAHVPRPNSPGPETPVDAHDGRYDSRKPWPGNVPCHCCRSSVDRNVPEGWKNKRGNTSIIVRRKDSGGQWKNILVDCGKSFVENARRFFPRWGVQMVDAVLLTHGHADAYFGLDDLREWCLRAKRHIPIYLNQETYDNVAASFPYLVDATKASGGGDLPMLQFNVIDDHSSFTLFDIPITSYPVHHGIYFSSDTAGTSVEPRPLICLAYSFAKSILYMADVSQVPNSTWALMEEDGVVPIVLKNQDMARVDSSSESPAADLVDHLDRSLDLTAPTRPQLKILIIDALWPLRRHLSHFSFGQAAETALRIQPSMTYLLGSTHPTTHYMWEEICLAVSGRASIHSPKSINPLHPCSTVKEESWSKTDHPDNQFAQDLVQRIKESDEFADQPATDQRGIISQWKESGGALEPAWDGLVCQVDLHSAADISADEGWHVVSGPQGSTGGWTA
ncbi:beta-lactamase-like protein [Kockovaella imperatae]|uniref:Beta-lactamase-like protein n=1 Tax=Kockovaella imperatae TaxID=4999 RepID=A0A1Y1UE98_9TREE|nr:beta-lactamase-like protein [Kockovaella imperatae]ORX36352.1 beta-lactamase-like protein [Kockovaella imperatae]